MTREEAIKELRRLYYAYRADEYGDYFYDNADDVCQAAGVAIAALREQPQWISVEDRLPETNARCLVSLHYRDWYETIDTMSFVKAYKSIGIPKRGDYWLRYDSEYGDINMTDTVTHWMPLPEPPEVEG